MPVSVGVVVAIVVVDEVVADTTCNTLPPPAGATHFKPVVSTESATSLQRGLFPTP